jgi:hypothetical protein
MLVNSRMKGDFQVRLCERHLGGSFLGRLGANGVILGEIQATCHQLGRGSQSFASA